MIEEKISFPGYMERCHGFSIPDNKRFLVVSFDDLVQFDLNSGEVTELDDWDFDAKRNVILLDGEEVPFIGLWGGNPVLKKDGVGELTLKESELTLKRENGSENKWQLENFSGDWEFATFDTGFNGILFGAPYDFDFRYISIT